LYPLYIMPRRTLKHAKRPAVVVGKIHANWCGHCKALVPEWHKMSQSLKQTHPHIMVEEVEQSNEAVGLNRINRLYRKGAVNQVALQGGYPTIFKIVKGKLSYYNGERTSEQLVHWVTDGLHGGYDAEIPSTQVMAKLPNMLGGGNQNSKKRKTQRKRNRTCRKCHNLFSFW
jgi:thiol-disulfide isomerase/thioredoxin